MCFYVNNLESKVPLCEKYILTIQEAAEYFHIGEKKLRRLVDERTDADYMKHRRYAEHLHAHRL